MKRFKVIFSHGENSRISNTVLKLLKKNGDFKFWEYVTPPHLRNTDEYIYQIEISLKKEDSFNATILRNEIISFIPDTFPMNYFFKFVDAFSVPPFNYKLEFSLTVPATGEYIHCYTKIKEKREKSVKITQHKIVTS